MAQEANLTMWNAAELHLILNHFPVILPIAGIWILLAGLMLRSETTMRVAYCLLFLGAVFAVPTYLSGGSAEAVAKNYPDVSRRIIHEHQDAGKVSLALLGVLGTASAALLAVSLTKRAPRFVVALFLIFALGSTGYVAYTAHLGGEIRHEEVRTGGD